MALSKRVLSQEHHKRPTLRLTEKSSISLHHAWAEENFANTKNWYVRFWCLQQGFISDSDSKIKEGTFIFIAVLEGI
jgi:hypothetical protein